VLNVLQHQTQTCFSLHLLVICSRFEREKKKNPLACNLLFYPRKAVLRFNVLIVMQQFTYLCILFYKPAWKQTTKKSPTTISFVFSAFWLFSFASWFSYNKMANQRFHDFCALRRGDIIRNFPFPQSKRHQSVMINGCIGGSISGDTPGSLIAQGCDNTQFCLHNPPLLFIQFIRFIHYYYLDDQITVFFVFRNYD
jgi:hypothetical protein